MLLGSHLGGKSRGAGSPPPQGQGFLVETAQLGDKSQAACVPSRCQALCSVLPTIPWNPHGSLRSVLLRK